MKYGVNCSFLPFLMSSEGKNNTHPWFDINGSPEVFAHIRNMKISHCAAVCIVWEDTL